MAKGSERHVGIKTYGCQVVAEESNDCLEMVESHVVLKRSKQTKDGFAINAKVLCTTISLK